LVHCNGKKQQGQDIKKGRQPPSCSGKLSVTRNFPTLRKTSKLGNSLQLTGFPPSQHVLFSNKNIKIKRSKAKHSGKKDFIFSQIVVNQLHKPAVFAVI